MTTAPRAQTESKPSAAAASSAVCSVMMLMVPFDAKSVSVGCASFLSGALLMNVSWPVFSDRKISPELSNLVEMLVLGADA